jgi:predicted phage terminase large subunit-like protein
LTYELRQMDIPVINFTPSKGNDKHARVNAVAPLFESGMIWAPEQKFADDVIEECAAFPYGDHDDLGRLNNTSNHAIQTGRSDRTP